MASTKMAKKQETGLVKWDEELAKHAQAESDKEVMPAGSFMSFKAGMLQVAGQPVKDNKANVVVLDSIFTNTYYEGKYQPDNPRPPVCYAFAREEGELAPHPDSQKPQSETCATCPMNIFGSADEGKGKACKNTRRLAVIPASDLTPDAVRDTEVFYASIPPTSVKGWAYYVKGLAATMKRPAFAVITQIGVVPDPKTQFKVTFQPIEALDNELIPAVMARREAMADSIMFPFAKAAEEEQPKPSKKARKF